MMKLRVHRSLGFWLGLMPAVFLLWVWGDSRYHETYWQRSVGVPALKSVGLIIAKCEVRGYERVYVVKPGSGYGAGFSFAGTRPWGAFKRSPVSSSDMRCPWFPAVSSSMTSVPFSRRNEEVLSTIDTRGFTFPLWPALAGYLVLWIGGMMWRGRRRRRLESCLALRLTVEAG